MNNQLQSLSVNTRRAVSSRLPARSAITLTEVLISMGILALGLLGVAAMFPVGGYYMQRAEIADRGSQIGQAAMSDLLARGMLNPRAWRVMTPYPVERAKPTSPNAWFVVDGTNPSATFTRPFAATLAVALREPAAITDPTLISKQFGSAFVIDPMGVAAMAQPGTNSFIKYNPHASAFPAAIGYGTPSAFYSASVWRSWGPVWPIRRVTYQQTS